MEVWNYILLYKENNIFYQKKEKEKENMIW